MSILQRVTLINCLEVVVDEVLQPEQQLLIYASIDRRRKVEGFSLLDYEKTPCPGCNQGIISDLSSHLDSDISL